MNRRIRILMPSDWDMKAVQIRSPRIIGALTNAGFKLERGVWAADIHSDDVSMPYGDIPTLVVTPDFPARKKLRDKTFHRGYLRMFEDTLCSPGRIVVEDQEILHVLKVFLADNDIVQELKLPPQPTREFRGIRGNKRRR